MCGDRYAKEGGINGWYRRWGLVGSVFRIETIRSIHLRILRNIIMLSCVCVLRKLPRLVLLIAPGVRNGEYLAQFYEFRPCVVSVIKNNVV